MWQGHAYPRTNAAWPHARLHACVHARGLQLSFLTFESPQKIGIETPTFAAYRQKNHTNPTNYFPGQFSVVAVPRAKLAFVIEVFFLWYLKQEQEKNLNSENEETINGFFCTGDC